MYHVMTRDPLCSPVTAQSLVDWARLDSDDPKIENSLLIATQLTIAFLKLDLLPRDYTLTYQDWPIVGTAGTSQLSRGSYAYALEVKLPFANTISITTVSINGDVLTTDDYTLIKGIQDTIRLDRIGYTSDDNPAIEIVYRAGFGEDFSTIPEPILQAITMCAGYVHAHAGACDMNTAINQSGASQLLRPYAVNGGLVF